MVKVLKSTPARHKRILELWIQIFAEEGFEYTEKTEDPCRWNGRFAVYLDRIQNYILDEEGLFLYDDNGEPHKNSRYDLPLMRYKPKCEARLELWSKINELSTGEEQYKRLMGKNYEPPQW